MYQDTPLTIKEFWTQILPGNLEIDQSQLVEGWKADEGPILGFTEAPLSLDRELSDAATDLSECSIILVSAPGAVGKTTLAKQICSQTGTVYIDLAQAATVGGYALTGGLAESNLWQDWNNDKLGLVIDALDEARVRVTGEAFEDFLNDVVSLTERSRIPPVLFGRTGAIEHAWAWLVDKIDKERLGILQIDFYDPQASNEFTLNAIRHVSSVQKIQKENGHPPEPTEPQREAIALILEKLRKETDGEQQRFAGYAPVLLAVANRVASESNTSQLVTQLKTDNLLPVSLKNINDEILGREQGKLDKLRLSDTNLIKRLYTPDEQLAHLSARLYGTPPPPLPPMDAGDHETYTNTLDTWIEEHPFLDGFGKKPSSAVFEAHICLYSLQSLQKEEEEKVLNEQTSRGQKANPFLSALYDDVFGTSDIIPAKHLGILYASVRSRLLLGQRASLEIYEQPSASNDVTDMAPALDFTIRVCGQDGNETPVHEGKTDRSSIIKLGPDVEDVNIEVTQGLRVELGGTEEINLMTPVSIVCETLSIGSQRMVVSKDNVASLTASDLNSHVEKVILRDKATLEIDCPQRNQYPWKNHPPRERSSEQVEQEIYQKVRRFVLLFRKHRKDRLAKYADHVRHLRRTQGIGGKVLGALETNRICTFEGNMCFLNPEILAEKTGLTYDDFRRCLGQDSDQFANFAKSIRENIS